MSKEKYGGDVKVIRETNRLPDQRKRNSRESGGRRGREEVLGREGEAWVQSRALPRKGRLHSRAEDGDKTGQDDKTRQAWRPGHRPGQEAVRGWWRVCKCLPALL